MRRFLPALLLILPILATGCGKSTSSGTSAVSGGKSASVFRYPITVEPATLDPARLNDVYATEMLQNVYEGLVIFNEKGEVSPATAEKWEISPDGLTYTFHIRSGVKFHNGRAVTAGDVKYSLERSLKDKQSPVAVGYLNPIVGAQALHDGKAAALEGAKVVDDHTLELKIDKPRGFFLSMLTYPTGWVVCKEEIEKNGGKLDEKIMAGSGPFKLTEYRHGAKVTLEANADYWGGKPKVDRIERPIVLDFQTSHIKFETGEIDACEMALSDFVNDQNSAALKDQAHAFPYASVQYMVLHPGLQPVFKDRRVRRALAMAIDRDSIAKSAGKGVWERADSYIPPGVPGANTGIKRISYDPAGAQKLLAEAGFPNGAGFPKVTLVYIQKQPESGESANIIRDNLKQNLNIVIDLQERDLATFLSNTSDRETIPLWTAGWIADYPDAQDFLSTLLRTGSPLNHVGYSNKEFDALCDKADAESDMAKRIPLYQQADQIAMDDVAVFPVYYRKQHYLIKPYVKDFKINAMMPLAHRTLHIEK